MDDQRLMYTALLGLPKPWEVQKVEFKVISLPLDGEVHVWVGLPEGTLWVCPVCQAGAPIHDHKERTWRHLDTCQFRTLIHARIPRLKCPNCGIKQLDIPWAEKGARFTALFEVFAIEWLKLATVKAVAQQLGLTWDEVDGIQQRAVARGKARRELTVPRYAGADETSFQKRHEYVTVVSDLEKQEVLYVADGRSAKALDGFWSQYTADQLKQIVAVAMDMCEPFLKSIKNNLPDWESKVVFDKFHIAQLVGRAMDKVRRQEYLELEAEGNKVLKKTKYLWLENPTTRTKGETREFNLLRDRVNRSSRAWALKETLMGLFDMTYLGAVDRNFQVWFRWAKRSKLKPMMQVADTLKTYWANIRTYFIHHITNAGSESMNAKIQAVKRRACGFRSRERFRTAIFFHCGGLNLYPTKFKLAA
jgi:transposase